MRRGLVPGPWQSVLYNSILRLYVREKQFLSASHFLQTAQFPSDVSDKQYVRYCYYKGTSAPRTEP